MSESNDGNIENFVSSKKKQKIVIVIRRDLDLSPGKLIAQAVHAALRVGKLPQYPSQFSSVADEAFGPEPICIVCYVKREKDLISLGERAVLAGLPCGLQTDAGFTEVEKGTITALAIGPDEEEKINRITKGLQIFKG